MAVMTLTPGGTTIARVDFNNTQDLTKVIFNGTTVYERRASFTCQIALTAAIGFDYYTEAATCGVDYYNYVYACIQKLEITVYNYIRINTVKLVNVRIYNDGVLSVSGYGSLQNVTYESQDHYSARNLTPNTKVTILDGSFTSDYPTGLLAMRQINNMRYATVTGTSNSITVELTFQVTTDVGTTKNITYTFTANTLPLPASISSSYKVYATKSSTHTIYNPLLYAAF